MKNKLSDLTNHLYEQIERLNDEDLTQDQLDKECKRSAQMSKIAGNIIKIASVSLQVIKLVSNGDVSKNQLPSILVEKTESETQQINN